MRNLNNFNFQPLIKAIERYIEKADKDLENQLKKEGFNDPKGIAKKKKKLEDKISSALKSEKKYLQNQIKSYESIEDAQSDIIAIQENDTSDTSIKVATKEEFEKSIKTMANQTLSAMDKDLSIDKLSKRTLDWIDSWSSDLGQLMKLSSYRSLETALKKGLDEGLSVKKVALSLEDLYGFSSARADRTALTEMLTAYSVSSQEAYSQNPAVTKKRWRHSFANEPRQNHIDMDGQTVDVNEPFMLTGADGGTYSPMYPRDTILPPGERINCHCISQPVVDDDVLGMSLKERKQLQQEALNSLDKDYISTLDEKNKVKAGIDENNIKMDWLKKKSKDEQIKYLGSKNRWALVESGVIENDKDLSKLYKQKTLPDGSKKNVKKTLQEIKDSGIITISSKTLNHSTIGEHILPSKYYSNGRLKNGGHSQTCIDELNNKKINYKIEKIYSNGVRIGGVSGHKDKNKIIGTVGQAWFPKDWTDDDILVAGTYVANSKSKPNGIFKFDTYKGVRVGIIIDNNGNPSTIFPDNSKQPFKNKWEVTDIDRYKKG